MTRWWRWGKYRARTAAFRSRTVSRSAASRRTCCLLESHAVGVVGDGRRPVRKDSDDADLARQRIEREVQVAVLADRPASRIEVVIEAGLRGAAPQIRALERPGDDFETRLLD